MSTDDNTKAERLADALDAHASSRGLGWDAAVAEVEALLAAAEAALPPLVDMHAQAEAVGRVDGIAAVLAHLRARRPGA